MAKMKPVGLYVGDGYREDWRHLIGWFDSHDEAVAAAAKLVEEGCDDEFLVEHLYGPKQILYSYQLVKQKCPVCGAEVLTLDMLTTSDCQGIPYRSVCPSCYKKLMEKGYDGEYYDEADECLDYDY